MRRRDFIALLGGAATAWPLAARAQQGPLRVVGVLMNGDQSDPEWQAYLAAFRQALRSLGWIERQNLRIETRWSIGDDPNHTRLSATELIQLAPDVILSSSTPNLTALVRQAPTVPIVFVMVSDPVAQGFVSNLARPEGNVTGLSSYEYSIGGKWTDLLKQVVPDLKHVSLIFNPDTAPQSKFFVSSVESGATALGVDVMAVPIHDTGDIERAIARVSRRPNSGLVFPTDNFLLVHRKLAVEAAVQHRVPAIYFDRLFPEAGGLMSYGYEFATIFRQAAIYVDRILRGAKPSSLPVQWPTKFSLVINVKAARALNLEVPMGLLLNADDYIE
jgi:putative tryptophan/tyrosine transport system substrate-binding protein